MQDGTVHIDRSLFGEREKDFFSFAGITVSLFRYESGIEALRITNRRGYLTILPFLGQMVWDAVFDGVDLTMKNMFSMPRPANVIVETYGCFAFHSGLLRNGCPGPEDNHPLHGEMSCAPMDRAWLTFGEDANGPWVAICGHREYAMGFGSHYLAAPRIVLRPEETLFDIEMAVTNLSDVAMDLMYMCHVNFALAKGARLYQPTDYSPESTVLRQSIPAHVVPTPEFKAFMNELATNPASSAILSAPERYDPEQVFFIRNLRSDAHGKTHLMQRRVEGDGFYISYSPTALPRTVRWILCNADQEVCAFALPATCEPEGYLAEKRKGNVRSLPGRETASFSVRLGYLDQKAAEQAATLIESL